MSTTADVNESGFKAGTILHTLAETWEGSSAEEKQAIVKKVSPSSVRLRWLELVLSGPHSVILTLRQETTSRTNEQPVKLNRS